MQVNVQRISPVTMEVQVEVPADLVRAEVEKAYTNLAKKAHIKGFRPGKAPRNVLTHLFAAQVNGDVANTLVNSTLPKALSEKQVTPVSTPAVVEAGKIDANAVFSYKARFEVQPEINPDEIKYEGFELTRPKMVADEKMVEEQLEKLRVSHATLKAPEPARPAQAKDVITIDFTIAVEGKPLKNAGGQGVQAELGAGQLLPELEAALTGKSVGDRFDVDAQFPEQHPNAELRGKKATFSVTVQDIKERILPTADDEFAKDIGFQTLVELRADIHTRLEKALKDRAETSLAEQIIEKLNEANPLEVPPSLVQQQCRVMEQEIAIRRGRRLTPEEAKAIHGQIHADAEKKVRAGLLMASIAKKHDIKITDEDFEKGLKELAEETGQNVAKLRVEYRDPNRRNLLLGILLEDKVLDLIESKAQIKEEGAEEPAAEVEKG